MEIIGNGFLARSVEPLADAHPEVVVFVSGVSSAHEVSDEEFHREAGLLYEQLRRCRETGLRLVYFSTSSIGMYGQTRLAGREEGPVFPQTSYGRHKIAMEAVITASGADYLILRLATPVGPHQRAHQFLPAMIDQVVSGSVRIHRGARRDLIDVRDMRVILDHLLLTGITREVVNVASGHAVPVEDVIDLLVDRLGVSVVRHIVDVAPERAVSIAKLRRLVPQVAQLDWGPDYYRRVVDRYLADVVSTPIR